MSTGRARSAEELTSIARDFLGAWNTQDVEKVLACYTPDVRYRDPNTRGEVVGADALGRYLTKLFDGWRMNWQLRELFPYGEGGANVLWTATLQPKGSDRSVTVDGMDLVLLDGDRIARNEVQFDRAVLGALMTPSSSYS